MTYTVGSVCTGIGGLDLGLERAGLGPVLWQVEPDPYCRRVLARHWPHADRSIRHVQAIPAAARSAHLDRVDVFVGGFPCQDLSQANPNGDGLDGERSGLFWWCLDAIDALQPRAVALENVGRLARRGLDVVVAELDRRGFAVECTRIKARDTGLPHERERLFILAYADGLEPERGGEHRNVGGSAGAADRQGLQRERDGRAAGDGGAAGRQGGDGAPESLVGGIPDVVPGWLDGSLWPAPRGAAQRPHEPRRTVAHYHGRREQLHGLGNAVAPACGYVVGRRLIEVLDAG